MVQHTPIRLQMIVSEPWEFGIGPVTFEVLEMLTEERWVVSVVQGWPSASDSGRVTLATRYVGETLLPILNGETVIGSVAVDSPNRPIGLIGQVRLAT